MKKHGFLELIVGHFFIFHACLCRFFQPPQLHILCTYKVCIECLHDDIKINFVSGKHSANHKDERFKRLQVCNLVPITGFVYNFVLPTRT